MSKADELKQQSEITLDKDTQQALSYLSGIPTTETTLVETIPDVSKLLQQHFQQLIDVWRNLQEDEIKAIGRTLVEILQGVDLSKKNVNKRLESPQYLQLIRKSFRNWSIAASEQKRQLVRNLLVNASGHTSSPDYVLSIFIDWLEKYSDEHFKVIEQINLVEPVGLSRKEIWQKLHDNMPGEDSAEADMYKLLIYDLSTGYLIRQQREKDYHGNFIRSTNKPTSKSSADSSSAFDPEKKYVLTELGKQFVVYTMTVND